MNAILSDRYNMLRLILGTQCDDLMKVCSLYLFYITAIRNKQKIEGVSCWRFTGAAEVVRRGAQVYKGASSQDRNWAAKPLEK